MLGLDIGGRDLVLPQLGMLDFIIIIFFESRLDFIDSPREEALPPLMSGWGVGKCEGGENGVDV